MHALFGGGDRGAFSALLAGKRFRRMPQQGDETAAASAAGNSEGDGERGKEANGEASASGKSHDGAAGLQVHKIAIHLRSRKKGKKY